MTRGGHQTGAANVFSFCDLTRHLPKQEHKSLFLSKELFKKVPLVCSSRVPRRNPIPQLEREIAARIKKFRVLWRCTRPHLAAQIGIDPEVLTRIESGRVPLKYGMAQKIFAYLPINPHWAATGEGLSKGYIVLPEPKDLKVSENALFSSVFFDLLLPTFKNDDVDFQLDMLMRYHRGLQLASLVKMAFRDVPDAAMGKFRIDLEKFVFDFLAKHPELDSAKQMRRQIWYENAKQFFDSPNAEAPTVKKTDFQQLTYTSTSNKLSGVKSEWRNLKKRIQAATVEAGSRSKLAKFLDVDLTQLSKWLTDSKSGREPGAEYTLRLLQWVEEQERQK